MAETDVRTGYNLHKFKSLLRLLFFFTRSIVPYPPQFGMPLSFSTFSFLPTHVHGEGVAHSLVRTVLMYMNIRRLAI